MCDLAVQLVEALPFALNGYNFTEMIGKGSLGTVFKAFSERWCSNFAIKVTPVDDALITPDGKLNDPELSALFSLDNPHIIRLYDYFVYEAHLFLVLEYCPYGTLRTLIRTQGLDLSMVSVVISELVEALFYCHEQNIAHRDIKPSNIFIDAGTQVKLADFGLSSFSMDRVATKCGTPNYAAPEIFSEVEIDPYKADVFSLGVVFYEMLVGSLPFPEGDLEKKGPVTVPDIGDARVAHVIEMMLDHDPGKRPSMAQLRQVGSPLCLVLPPMPSPQRKRVHRNSLPSGGQSVLPMLRKNGGESKGTERIPLSIHLSHQQLLQRRTGKLGVAAGIVSARNLVPRDPRAKFAELCMSNTRLQIDRP